MSVYKLYGSAPANAITNALASLDIRVDGTITAVYMNISPNGMDALNDAVNCECSFGSTNSFTTNDVLGSLMMLSIIQQFLTSGGGVSGSQASMGNLNIPVFAGERVHVHTQTSSGVTADCTCYLYVDDGVELKAQRRRR